MSKGTGFEVKRYISWESLKLLSVNGGMETVSETYLELFYLSIVDWRFAATQAHQQYAISEKAVI